MSPTIYLAAWKQEGSRCWGPWHLYRDGEQNALCGIRIPKKLAGWVRQELRLAGWWEGCHDCRIAMTRGQAVSAQ